MLVYDKHRSFGNGFKEIAEVIEREGVVGKNAYFDTTYLQSVNRVKDEGSRSKELVVISTFE
jgi:hypothetical protein